MADHVYKNKATGVETLLPESFAKTKHAEGFDDLGEGYLHKDPVSGINSVKLKEQAAAEVEPVAETEATPPAADAVEGANDETTAEVEKPEQAEGEELPKGKHKNK